VDRPSLTPGRPVLNAHATPPRSCQPRASAGCSLVDPQQPIYNVRTLDEVAAGSVAVQRFNALLLTLFACLAVILTLVGVYGLMAYWVTASTKEIGVRIALGANRHEVLAMVLGRSLRLTVLGAAAGIVIALVTVRFLAGLLYGVKPTDFATFASATLFVLGASLAASYFPARRALSIDPAESLKSE